MLSDSLYRLRPHHERGDIFARTNGDEHLFRVSRLYSLPKDEQPPRRWGARSAAYQACGGAGGGYSERWLWRRTPVPVVCSAYGALLLALLPSASGLVVPGRSARRLPPPGGHLNRACDTGDTRHPRPGCHGGPDNGGVNPCPPAVGCGQPSSPAMETLRRTTMPVPMKRTAFWLRKEITVYEYERGLLYRDGKLERVLEPGRYTFWATERVDVTRVSLR